MSKLNVIATASTLLLLSLAGEMAIAGEPRQHTDREPGLKCVATTDRRTIRDRSPEPIIVFEFSPSVII